MRTPKAEITILLLFFLWTPRAANAQLIRGFVSGAVTDSTGAVIPQVEVTITNQATNISRATVTSGAGFYRFAAVEPGDYTVEFKFAGFSTVKAGPLTVNTAQEVVVDQAMQAGAVTASITVEETPGAALAKTTATIQRTLGARVVAELPMQIFNGSRDISRLALLAPTVVRASSFTEFSANGQRTRNNNFIVDGVDNNDPTVTQHSIRIIPESVQEVQVQTVAYSSEFGHSSGAQFSAITKSGTNVFHGEVWDYHRGNWMEPLSLTNKRAGITSTPRFVLNQFGGDIGGPILKDRTFFFGLIEANRRREAPAAANATPANIPTPAGYAALSSVPLGPGETAAGRQAALSALSFLPGVHAQVANYQNIQNVTINGAPIQVGTIRIPLAWPSNLWYSAARIDHRVGERANITYRYHLDRSDQPDATGNRQFGPRFTAKVAIRRQNHAASYTRTFSNRFLNETRLAYARGRFAFPENDPTSATVNINNFFTIGGLNAFPQSRFDQVYQLQNVASYIVGRHSLRFGTDIRRNRLHNRFGLNSKGTWTFGNLADFLNNNALNLQQAVSESTFDSGQWNHAYFFQDDVKVTPKLTLNAGIRYEYSTIPFGFFGATDPAIRAAGVPGPVQADNNNWAPRLGFAYSPDARTSIRGGFGAGYDVVFYQILANTAGNYPRVVTSTTSGAATANLFPTLAPKVTTVPPLSPATTFVNMPEDSQNPTTNFWSLSVQRELGPDYLVELGYTGNRSYHQIRQRDANPGVLTSEHAARAIATGNPNPPGFSIRRLNSAWGPRLLLETAAKAEYHAAYLKFDKRMSKGLLIGANYAWSANFSDNDEAFGGNDIVASSPQVPQDFFNYRSEWSRSAFDRPHRLAVHYIYEIPSLRREPVVERIFGGWQIAGFTEFQSGQPFTIRTGVDTVGTLAAAFPGRPNYNPGGMLLKDTDTGDFRTFRTPLDGTGIVVAPMGPNGILANSMPGGGNLGRNTFRGPSFQNWNFSLLKNISIKDNWRVQLRGDFINLWNHNNFQNPVATMSSTAFGANTANLLTDTRQILASAKIRF
ncbi:MAG: TonB-dependent receptor [Acidobacteria bacterium]|nr:TonB-dependent receptor [Acidobacteriota bacterium]